jgi:hypothetical protein
LEFGDFMLSRVLHCGSTCAGAIAVAATILAGMVSAQSRSSRTEWITPDAESRLLFAGRHLRGAIVVQDVKSGTIVSALDSDTPVLPLSVVKLFTAAIYWEHRGALPTGFAGDPGALVARGSDDTGRQLALNLRHALGSATLLSDLERFGFPRCHRGVTDCTTLTADTGDAEWANAMSLGETGFHATPRGLSHFLRIIGNRGAAPGEGGGRAIRPDTARLLQTAMINTVHFGSARGIRDRLGVKGQIGGKTGSGPGGASLLDGIFAGIVFDRASTARYTVLTYVRSGGPGGGAAVEISVDMANFLLSGRKD